MNTTAILDLMQHARELGRDWAEVERDSCDPQDDQKFATNPGREVDAVEVLNMHNLGLPEDQALRQCALQLCLLARRERWQELLHFNCDLCTNYIPRIGGSNCIHLNTEPRQCRGVYAKREG